MRIISNNDCPTCGRTRPLVKTERGWRCEDCFDRDPLTGLEVAGGIAVAFFAAAAILLWIRFCN